MKYVDVDVEQFEGSLLYAKYQLSQFVKPVPYFVSSIFINFGTT